MAVSVLYGALALLAMLTQPVLPVRMLCLCTAAFASALPGMLAALVLKKNRAAWANWLAFGNMLPLALPLACFASWPELAVFAISHHLVRVFMGGWLLRRDGIRTEKNFTLILAYRQTLTHHYRFPGELHPRENPLFQPARNAQHALAELLPLAGLLLGWLLNAAGAFISGLWLKLPAAAFVIALLAVSIREHSPKTRPARLPEVRQLPIALLRALLLALAFDLLPGMVFQQLFSTAESDALVLCALLPSLTLAGELRRGGADAELCDEIAGASQWAILLWLIATFTAAICMIQ